MNKTNKQIRGTPWEYFLQSYVVQTDVSEAEALSAPKQKKTFVFAALHIGCKFRCIYKNTRNRTDIQSSLVVHYSEREDKNFLARLFSHRI
jgi:hypothetical protein